MMDNVIVDYNTITAIERHYNENIIKARDTKETEAKLNACTILVRFVKNNRVCFVLLLICLILLAVFSGVRIVRKNPAPQFEVCILLALLICYLIIIGNKINEIITESSGYVPAIKAAICADDIRKMAHFLIYSVGIKRENTLGELISFQEKRKKRVEDYRSNRTEIIIALISGLTGMTAVKSLLDKGADSSNVALIIFAMFVSLSGFIVEIIEKKRMNKYWSDADEELLDMLRMVKLNAHSLGFR